MSPKQKVGGTLILMLLAAIKAGDEMQAYLLRSEVRETFVDPFQDAACVTCLEPLTGSDACAYCRSADQ